jgi:hypothetical protein
VTRELFNCPELSTSSLLIFIYAYKPILLPKGRKIFLIVEEWNSKPVLFFQKSTKGIIETTIHLFNHFYLNKPDEEFTEENCKHTNRIGSNELLPHTFYSFNESFSLVGLWHLQLGYD